MDQEKRDRVEVIYLRITRSQPIQGAFKDQMTSWTVEMEAGLDEKRLRATIRDAATFKSAVTSGVNMAFDRIYTVLGI